MIPSRDAGPSRNWEKKLGRRVRSFARIVLLSTSLWGLEESTGWANSSTPLLTIDAGGHTDMVTALIVGEPGELISGSIDKTIRVWNWNQGKTVRVIRGEASLGRRGEVRSLALTPDRTLLFAGGYFDDKDQGLHPIRIYAWPLGKIQGLLYAHDRAVHALAVSSQGEFLASGDQRGVVRLWRKTGDKYEHVAGVEAHTTSVTSLAFDPSNVGSLVSTSSDGSACYWTVSGTRLTQKKKLRPTSMPVCTAAAFRPDGGAVAFAGSQQMATNKGDYGEVVFYDKAGNKIGGPWSLATGVRSLVFSPVGDRIVLGCGYPGTDKKALVFSFPEGKLLTQFRRHDDSVAAAVFLDAGLIATAGGQDNAIRVWNSSTDAPIATLTAGTRSIWSVGVSSDGLKLLWGDRLADPDAIYGLEKYNNRGPLEYSFDLTAADMVPAEIVSREASRALRGSIQHNGEQLQLLQGQRFQFLRVGNQGKEISSRLDNDVVYAVSFLPQASQINSGSTLPPVMMGGSRALGIFDPVSGRSLKALVGHSGYALAVAPFPHGQFAVSGGGDQTVRLWNVTTGKLLLSVFRAGVDWVAFTPEGYYAASPQGDRLIGWQVNQGEGRDPEHFVATQFQKSLFRPDIIRAIVETGDVRSAAEKANLQVGKVDRELNVSTTLPPTVVINQPAKSVTLTANQKLKVRATATGRGVNPVISMQLLIDGRPFEGLQGRRRFDSTKPGPVNAEWDAVLPAGLHRISVLAESEVSKAISAELDVTVPAASNQPKADLPALYILAIGVAAYPQDELKLNFAARDAEAIERVFREKSGTLFRDVKSMVVTDAKATEREIRKGFSWFQQQMTSQDVGVVFFSGHGQKDSQGILYLLPFDVDTENLSATAIPEERLKSTVAGTPGRVMVLLDACHAGAFAGDKRKSIGSLTDNLARDLINDDFGSIVMCSSMGREESLESAEHKQGYFTLALTEGLSGKADQNSDGAVYLHELKFYLTERIKELTKGKQHPVLAESSTIRSFPVSNPGK